MKFALAAIFLATAIGTAEAHSCDSDAREHAEVLLKFHFGDDTVLESQDVAVDDTVRQLAPVKALKGNARFDVLEVWGHIYKSDYRMRFLYTQIPGDCLLMGQEIFEASDPQ